MLNRFRLSSAMVLMALSLALPAHAQEQGEAGHEDGHVEAHEPAEGHDGAHGDTGAHGHGHRNLVAGFIGVTSEERREGALALGIDYNRWITPSFGIGAGVERAFGDQDFWVYTVPFSYRNGPWKLFAGPGWEDADHHHDEHSTTTRSGSADEEGGGTEFLVRAGVECSFLRGRYEISPKSMVDVFDGDAVFILGVSFGYGF